MDPSCLVMLVFLCIAGIFALPNPGSLKSGAPKHTGWTPTTYNTQIYKGRCSPSQAVGPEKLRARVANRKLWRKQLGGQATTRLVHLCQGYTGLSDAVSLTYHLSHLPMDPTLLCRANLLEAGKTSMTDCSHFPRLFPG